MIHPLSPERPLGLYSSPAVLRQQAACRSSSSTHGEPRDPQPPTGERGWEAPRSSRKVLASHPVTSSCLFLSAVTDGIPATSEGDIQATLKLEHIDGVDLVSQVWEGTGGDSPNILSLKRSQRYRLGVAGSLVP